MKHDIYGENQDLRIKVLRLESENKKLQLENKELNEKFSLYGVSHQRELLKAYTKWLDDKLRDSDELDELMDDYFRSL